MGIGDHFFFVCLSEAYIIQLMPENKKEHEDAGCFARQDTDIQTDKDGELKTQKTLMVVK